MTAMNGPVRHLLALAVLLGAAGCATGGFASSARSGCYDQPAAGSQGYNIGPTFFIFCRQNP